MNAPFPLWLISSYWWLCKLFFLYTGWLWNYIFMPYVMLSHFSLHFSSSWLCLIKKNMYSVSLAIFTYPSICGSLIHIFTIFVANEILEILFSLFFSFSRKPTLQILDFITIYIFYIFYILHWIFERTKLSFFNFNFNKFQEFFAHLIFIPRKNILLKEDL